MKKLNLLLLGLCLVLSLTNCSSDDNYDSEQPTTSIEQNKLIGIWYSEEGAIDKMTLNFTSSSKATFTYHGFGNNGEDIQETGKWSLSGNTLKILWDEADAGLENWSAEILELNNTTLKWKELIDGKYYIQTYYRK